MKIQIVNIRPNPQQPRTTFDKAEMDELIQSMREHGLINPISVEVEPDGYYTLIDGERRTRAAKELGWKEIEASIRVASNDKNRLTLAVVGNVQRVDMNPIDEAKAYQSLRMMGLNDTQIVAQTGKSRNNIINKIWLLDLPEVVQKYFSEGKIPIDQNLIKLLHDMDSEDALQAGRMIASRGLSARAAISYISRRSNIKKVNIKRTNKKSEELKNGTWDAFQLVDLEPGKKDTSFPTIVEVTRKTCKKCPLFDVANKRNCAECPLPILLNDLFGSKKS